MRILFCSSTPITDELGAPRALLGIAGAMNDLGWECRLVGSGEVHRHATGRGSERVAYAEALRIYLKDVAADYDVIDYPCDHLPYPRSEFPRKPLFVARSALLPHHFVGVRIPQAVLPLQRIKRLFTGELKREQVAYARWLESSRLTVDYADLINVANEDDRMALVSSGIDARKIVVIRLGLSAAEHDTLNRLPPVDSATPRLCFLGTFDHRKGGADLPRLFAEVRARVHHCQFRLIGTAGMHQTEARVRAFFPRRLQGQIEVVPRFSRHELAGLLDGCTVGVFPSYVEGFGFGVLEMMAAGMPVVAYRSPGPMMMLPDELLSPRGNVRAMAERVALVLLQPEERRSRGAWCQRRAREFTWEIVGNETDHVYRRAAADTPVMKMHDRAD